MMMSDPTVSAENLKDWIARGARGDEDACARLYREFSPAVLRLSFGLLNDLRDAEEVMQDAFVYALRNLKRFDPEKSAFRTWLFTIAISRCRNKRRRKWLATLPLSLLNAEPAPGSPREVEALLARRGVRRQIWEVLQELSPRLREALVLRYLGDLKYGEIGQALGCNAKTAESRVRLGLIALRGTLKRLGVEAEAELAELSV